MADLQELFARIQSAKPAESLHSQPPPPAPARQQQQQQQHIAYNPSLSSPIFPSSSSAPYSGHSPTVLSPNTLAMNIPDHETGGQKTRGTDLLSLLKFRQGTQRASSMGQPEMASTETVERRSSQGILSNPLADVTSGAQSRSVSAADLVAGFTRKPSQLGSMHSPAALAPASSRPELRGEASASSAKSQEFLLKLLNHQANPHSDAASFTSSIKHDPVPEAVVDNLAQEIQDAPSELMEASPLIERKREESPMHLFGEADPPPSTFLAVEAPKSKVFTYVNPFEQLSASSPLNEIPAPQTRARTPQVEILKHARDFSNTSGPAAKARKVSPNKSTRRFASPTPASTPRGTVSEALKEVGEVVDKQVEEALALTSKANGDSELKELEAEKLVREAAEEIKKDLQDDEARKEIVAGMSKPMVQAFEETIEAAAAEPSAKPGVTAAPDDDWEEAAKAADKDIRVFSFPMRPFGTIEIKQLEQDPPMMDDESQTVIARIKKDFDQIDRNMVSGSNDFMVYPLKYGGLRVVKQEDGSHKQIFSGTKERIFNIALSHSRKGSGFKETEAVLATGVEGTVFWAPLANYAHDESFGQSEEECGIIFPPVPTSDENTSGGQLKTRVKPSSRHPEFFGYGRGKSIYMIFPSIARSAAYTDPESRRCNSEKYLQQHQLKISTGKAGKDFIFSADDTVVISLDKAGNLKFWDIRPLTQVALQDKVPPSTPIDVRVPMMTLATCLPTEKSWPTSVMLLDKEKPMNKGIALRYVIIGMKQNHTLQIWDLSLGKVVEEINFPHERESDAICSLAYHPRTGMLALGHPTRNSIYLMHVSPPQYNLEPMSQAKYISRIANKDADLAAPQSTIIISGIREYTLGDKGTIRSLDMLNEPGPQFGDKAPLFVLYVMHSKGIMEMRFTNRHLGWAESGKILHKVDAVKAGAIVVGEIRPLPAPLVGDAASVADESPAADAAIPSTANSKASKEENKVDNAPARERKPPTVEQVKVEAAPANGEKSEKKKRKEKKIPEAPQPASTAAPSSIQVSETITRDLPKSPTPLSKSESDAKTPESDVPPWAARLLETAAASAQNAQATSTRSSPDNGPFENLLANEFERLYRKIGDDKRVQEAAGAAKQEAVLRLVSSTLAENVEASLNRVVVAGLTAITLKPLQDLVSSTIERNLSVVINQSVKASVPNELEKSLPLALGKILQDPKVLHGVSERISGQVAQQVDRYLSVALQESVMPAFNSFAINTANKVSAEVERRVTEQLRQVEVQQQRDNAKIDVLLTAVANLTEVIHGLSKQHAQSQDDIKDLLEVQMQAQQVLQSQERSVGATPRVVPNQMLRSPAEEERDEISALLARGDYENATIKWVHSAEQNSLFLDIFMHLDPEYLQQLSPIINLTICAVVSNPLVDHCEHRLLWLDRALSLLDPRNPELTGDILSRILSVISSRLQEAYMTLSEMNGNDPTLKSIAHVNRRVNGLRAVADGPTD